MNLRALFKKDLGEVITEIGSRCQIAYKGNRAVVNAVISDAQFTNGGYTFIEGESVSFTAQLDGDKIPFKIGIGATLTTEGRTYRVTSITRTEGDSSITLALTLEGKQ